MINRGIAMTNTYKPACFYYYICIFVLLSFAFIPVIYGAEKTVKIKVAQYDDFFELLCTEGATFELGNTPGKISPGDSVTIEGKLTKKAVKRYHVMVISLTLDKANEMPQMQKEWLKNGFNLSSQIIGQKVFNDSNDLLCDNRKLAATAGVFDDIESAQALVDKLAAQGKSSWIHTEIVSLASGQLSLKVNGIFQASGNELLIIPANTGRIKLKKVEYAAGYPWHGFEDRTYEGTMLCRFGAQNAIDCIVSTSLENILAGVVPSEISANAKIGALQAQAVAARGEILSKIGIRHQGEGFDICSEQHCQVYAGVTYYSQQVAPKIAPTRGYVLTEANGKILDAVYSANCGGHTEANHFVWSGQPNSILSGVWDHTPPLSLDLTEEEQVRDFILNPPPCHCNNPAVEGGNRFRWQKSFSTTDWKKIEQNIGVGRIKKIKNIARGYSGRIYQMTFIGEFGEKTIMKELNIRRAFASLMSACFVLDLNVTPTGFINSAKVYGAGFGHGVGMCQTGAQSLATKGWNFKRILDHYFPGSKLRLMY
jgi:SpoIID/LytB domain protein